MKAFISLMVILAYGLPACAQGENNVWSFGPRYSLDFNVVPPLLRDNILLNNQPATSVNNHYEKSIVACNAAGQIEFMVKLRQGSTMPGSQVSPTTPMIFDRNMEPIPGTHLMNTLPVTGQPVVIPHPGNQDQYYIFYSRNHGLMYSLFDMGLNNGLGQIVPGEHNVLLCNYNTAVGNYMTTVQSCTGVWLVIRDRVNNGYKSFLVDKAGIHPEPVLSEVGLLPLGNYNLSWGVLNSSPDSRMLAMGCLQQDSSNATHPYNYPGGLELYDFEPCSGKVKNARLLDSGWYYGICFSPDNSKLYATRNDKYVPGLGYRRGYLFQFDLNQPTLPGIINSRTQIIDNPMAIVASGPCPLWNVVLGDIKLGPDERMYLLNYHPGVCSGTGMAFHIIQQPDNPGLTCLPLLNALFNTMNGMHHNSGFDSAPQYNLPSRIMVAPPLPDTLPGETRFVTACFTDSLLLQAKDGFECYRWEDGTTGQVRNVTGPGTYYVRYFDNCTVTIDTYKVDFVPMPEVPQLSYGCPGEIILSVNNKAGNYTHYSYSLTNENLGYNYTSEGNSGYTFTGLWPGTHTLHVTTKEGCDTTIAVRLEAYPKPDLVVSPSDTTIRYGGSITLHVSGADIYAWWPSSPLDSTTLANPVARPLTPTLFTVMGINAYGCRDTGYVNINIDYTMPDMVPNAFSPNGDGLNDVFRIEGATYQKVRTFHVFNRYGQRIFSTLDAAKGWDGTQNGVPCDAGTYYYLIQLDYPDGHTKTYKGDVTLIR